MPARGTQPRRQPVFFSSRRRHTRFSRDRSSDVCSSDLALQHIPYQGFPNADMDMQGNVAAFFNARYAGGYEWGDLHIVAYYDHIQHEMNGNAPDRFPPSLSITG